MLPRTGRILLSLLCLWPALSMGTGDDPLRVHVSIKPLQYLVERVGGVRVDVGVVVRAGQSPETYEPTPREIGALAEADVFFGVGMPLEAAWRRQLRQSDSSRPEWIDLSEALPAHGETHEHENSDDRPADGEHDRHDGMDPHVWLSPANAQRMAASIFDVLGRLDPVNIELFEENAADLKAELQSLDQDIAALLAGSGVEAFLVYHPAWGHFARAYGLKQISIEAEGKEPGPRGLVEVVHRAEEYGIRILFIDPMHSDRLARTVADAIGARLVVLDPLAYDYLDNLRRAARAIAASGS